MSITLNKITLICVQYLNLHLPESNHSYRIRVEKAGYGLLPVNDFKF